MQEQAVLDMAEQTLIDIALYNAVEQANRKKVHGSKKRNFFFRSKNKVFDSSQLLNHSSVLRSPVFTTKRDSMGRRYAINEILREEGMIVRGAIKHIFSVRALRMFLLT